MSAEPEPIADSAHASTPQDDALCRFLRDCTDYASAQQFWEAVQESIKERLGLQRFSLWFRQTELMSASEQRLVVGVPNVIIQQFLALRYADAVASAAQELLGRPVQVTFDVAPRLFRQMRARREAELADGEANAERIVGFRAPSAELRVPSGWSFDDLIVCRANRLPYAAARELAGQDNPRFRFLYICGNYGLGKTALLRAIFALAGGLESGLNPLYMAAEDWCNEYYHAIQRKTTRPFRARYRSCNMLLLDDIQFVEGKAGGQLELLHTVKHILARGGRVALSSARRPEELQDIDPALRALLQSAFTAVLLPPGDESLAVVKELAARRGLDAVEGVLRLIAEKYGDSFARIESAICQLVLYAGVEGCGKVELSAARDAFAVMHPTAGWPVDLGAIKQAVLEAFAVSAEQLTGRSRCRTVCRARHVAIYLARKLTDASLTEIGRAFGRVSHSTVKHAAEKVARGLQADAHLAALVERLEKRLSAP